MDTKIKEKCDLFMLNYNILNKKYKKINEDILLISSIIFTGYDVEVDLIELGKCGEIIKNNEHKLSEFRGRFYLPLITKMSISKEPEKYYLRVRMTYEMLNQNEWLGSSYKIIAAMSICDNVSEYNVADTVDRTLLIYQKIKALHPYITTDEDITFASLLAVTDSDIDLLIDETEKCYSYLCTRFKHKNAIQSLSHVLTLGATDVTDKCTKVINIYNDIKQRGKKYGSYFELSALGVFAMIEKKEKEIVNDICLIDDYIKGMKCFRATRLGEDRRLMYSALLANDVYIPKRFNAEQVAISSTIATLIAEEILLTATILSITKFETVK